ncbi:c-Myc-binding protein homolog [Agrilus planipennis]|uniref:c-Myc-binding protein homolog n=1 Tax=Agrilus planipennis TaxID=224129 RepID=A0A1W4X5V7_AGRPL|nr:c-Myc-binding protein homolog [Agrilus planipennis]XP_018328212.1 c-Myc-binding protein homolog [Agrilus planipennis]XP_018328213.1 c-Myc-binding protein homolog [Agrilus planipennis]XP_018328214.1 c-Myc-binding protein homolog [Agrilus planipennis]
MSSNPAYRPSEGKREEFRKYLEKTGVIEALTRVLVCLYEEVDKPEDALHFIRNKLASLASLDTPDELQEKLESANCRIQELEEQLAAMENRGEEHEGETETSPPAPEGEVPPAEAEA